jgi:pimeloyl-ACP methyl ester carboxylesterase
MTDLTTPEPTLLFLHGVGDGDQDDTWKAQLSDTLSRLGYPDLNSARVIAPKYAHALKGSDDIDSLPDVTVKQPTRDAARKNRREFERRMGAIEYRLGRPERGKGHFARDAVVDVAVLQAPFVQAHNYVNDPLIRAHVLHRILKTLPESGPIVIIGHSLGSVIAADLLRRLPIGLHVAGLITIGSPLANGSFNVDKLRETLKEPPTNLAWWVNFWNAADPVAAQRGVSSILPWMIDYRIETSQILHHAHAAVEYLGDQTVGTAIGFALFGSRSQELAQVDTGMDVPLDSAEIYTLLALRYAHMIRMRLDGDIKDRFTGALRQVQATSIDAIASRNRLDSRPMPAVLARLRFDFSDAGSSLPEPFPIGHMTKDEAVALLVVVANENILRPFEIAVTKDKRLDALKDLTAEMGLGSQFGGDLATATKRAQDTLGGGGGLNWVKWGALGVGAAAIVLATGGLALAAAPGLAGAAVITSALAAFGPGGMIGGLVTAGTLVTAGGGGIAFGLASPSTTAETLEAIVSRQLGAAILRQLQGLEQDPNVWRNLVETEIEVRREYERLDEFSDESATALKELKRKVEALERVLKYLIDNKLVPEVPRL